MNIPGDLRFAKSHEWVRVEDDGTVTVGVSDFAQAQLGDLVFVETPEIDSEVEAGDGVAVVESVKAASDIYAPIAGTVIDANADLADAPETLNDSPYENGWLFKMKPNDVADVEELMSPDDYQQHIEAEE